MRRIRLLPPSAVFRHIPVSRRQQWKERVSDYTRTHTRTSTDALSLNRLDIDKTTCTQEITLISCETSISFVFDIDNSQADTRQRGHGLRDHASYQIWLGVLQTDS
jgi:hypothetical protein